MITGAEIEAYRLTADDTDLIKRIRGSSRQLPKEVYLSDEHFKNLLAAHDPDRAELRFLAADRDGSLVILRSRIM